MDETAEPTAPRPEEAEALVGVPVGGRAREAAPRPATPSWVIPMVVLALVAGLGIGLAVGMLVGNDGAEAAPSTTAAAGASSTVPWGPEDAYAAVTAGGDPLPVLGSADTDTAVGMPVPEIAGFDYEGNATAITANGKAKLIVALAHWCPYCNEEVPVLLDWYAAGLRLPEGVEVISLSVYADPNRAHFPPAAWLRDVAWILPTIADDEARTLVRTLGIPAVPFWLLVAADGTVMERGTGVVAAEALDGILATLAETTAAP